MQKHSNVQENNDITKQSVSSIPSIKMHSPFGNFLCGISHTKSEAAICFIYLFIYLCICLFVHWCARHVVSSLGVSMWEDWVPVYFVPFMFRGGPLLFSAVVILLSLNWRFWIVLLVHMVSRTCFPFCHFRWVYLSLNLLYKLKFWPQNIPIDRWKTITSPFFLTAFFLIWDFPSDISWGVYNRRSFVTGAVWLYSQANSHRLGPFLLVQVVIKGPLYFRKPILVGLNLTVWVAQKVSKSHKYLTSVSKC